MIERDALAIYAGHAPALAARYDAVRTEDILSGLTDLLPAPPAPVLDIGAGSGRDSVWLAQRGHAVTAAEPVAAFRDMLTARLPGARIVPAALPDLADIDGAFPLILANAVWHHLTPPDRARALARIADLLAPSGVVLIALRRGPIPPDQPLYPLDPDAEAKAAENAGLTLIRRHDAPAWDILMAAGGVSWTWLALQKATRT